MRRVGSWRVGLLLVVLLAGVCSSHGGKAWRTYDDARWLPNPANDGDSFHAKVGRRQKIFRLYFVDAPETDLWIAARVDEQAAYWGVSREDVLQLGAEAKAFTEDFLRDGFAVKTRHEDALGASQQKRSYALVRVGGRDLGEALVAQGLARVYGRAADAPGERPASQQWNKLRALEQEARKQRLGAWGLVDDNSTAHGPVDTAPEETSFRLGCAIQVYSIRSPGTLRGVLRAGSEVKVLGREGEMVRIRFVTSQGVRYEGLCRSSELAGAR